MVDLTEHVDHADKPVTRREVRRVVGRMWRVIYGMATVLIVSVGLLTLVYQDVDETSESAADASAKAAIIAAEDAQQDLTIIDSQRYACEGLNQLRVNQGSGLQFQIDQTEVLLRRGLGTLEPFRSSIVEQNQARKRQLQRLRDLAREFPVEGSPYRVDCEKAAPYPEMTVLKEEP